MTYQIARTSCFQSVNPYTNGVQTCMQKTLKPKSNSAQGAMVKRTTWKGLFLSNPFRFGFAKTPGGLARGCF